MINKIKIILYNLLLNIYQSLKNKVLKIKFDFINAIVLNVIEFYNIYYKYIYIFNRNYLITMDKCCFIIIFALVEKKKRLINVYFCYKTKFSVANINRIFNLFKKMFMKLYNTTILNVIEFYNFYLKYFYNYKNDLNITLENCLILVLLFIFEKLKLLKKNCINITKIYLYLNFLYLRFYILPHLYRFLKKVILNFVYKIINYFKKLSLNDFYFIYLIYKNVIEYFNLGIFLFLYINDNIVKIIIHYVIKFFTYLDIIAKKYKKPFNSFIRTLVNLKNEIIYRYKLFKIIYKYIYIYYVLIKTYLFVFFKPIINIYKNLIKKIFKYVISKELIRQKNFKKNLRFIYTSDFDLIVDAGEAYSKSFITILYIFFKLKHNSFKDLIKFFIIRFYINILHSTYIFFHIYSIAKEKIKNYSTFLLNILILVDIFLRFVDKKISEGLFNKILIRISKMFLEIFNLFYLLRQIFNYYLEDFIFYIIILISKLYTKYSEWYFFSYSYDIFELIVKILFKNLSNSYYYLKNLYYKSLKHNLKTFSKFFFNEIFDNIQDSKVSYKQGFDHISKDLVDAFNLYLYDVIFKLYFDFSKIKYYFFGFFKFTQQSFNYLHFKQLILTLLYILLEHFDFLFFKYHFIFIILKVRFGKIKKALIDYIIYKLVRSFLFLSYKLYEETGQFYHLKINKYSIMIMQNYLGRISNLKKRCLESIHTFFLILFTYLNDQIIKFPEFFLIDYGNLWKNIKQNLIILENIYKQHSYNIFQPMYIYIVKTNILHTFIFYFKKVFRLKYFFIFYFCGWWGCFVDFPTLFVICYFSFKFSSIFLGIYCFFNIYDILRTFKYYLLFNILNVNNLLSEEKIREKKLSLNVVSVSFLIQTLKFIKDIFLHLFFLYFSLFYL